MKYEVAMQKTECHRCEVEADSEADAYRLANARYPEYLITDVGDLGVSTVCEACGRPIFDGEDYACLDDYDLCNLCYEEARKAST